MRAHHQTGTASVLIADDQASMRAEIKLLLDGQPDLKVVGEAQNGVRALTLAGELKPTLILLDLTMPGSSGLDVLRTIKGITPRSKVLVLIMHDNEDDLAQALVLGAVGYVIKKAVVSDLLNAIRAVMQGDS